MVLCNYKLNIVYYMRSCFVLPFLVLENKGKKAAEDRDSKLGGCQRIMFRRVS